MKALFTCFGLGLMVSAMAAMLPAPALAGGHSPHAGPPGCTPPPHCSPASETRRLVFPAGSLSYGTPASSFSPQARGLRWDDTSGVVTMTIRRPPGYSDGPVTVSIFHELLEDSGGDIAFIVTPVSFNHLSSFETYGDELTNLVAGISGPGIMLEHSATLQAGDHGYGWPPRGEWWYFEFRRAGSFSGKLQLMSVSIDY